MATRLDEAVAPPAGFAGAEELARRLRPGGVEIRSDGGGAGSGVVWRADGVIVTNAHVVHSSRPTVELWDGRELRGRVVALDRQRDLAVVLVDARELGVPGQGEAARLRPGELVFALGHPLGWVGALGMGVVHAVVPGRRGPRWVLADIRLAPGNSGGPLFDARGEVVGINAMVVRGLGVAVPAEVVRAFLREAAVAARAA